MEASRNAEFAKSWLGVGNGFPFFSQGVEVQAVHRAWAFAEVILLLSTQKHPRAGVGWLERKSQKTRLGGDDAKEDYTRACTLDSNSVT